MQWTSSFRVGVCCDQWLCFSTVISLINEFSSQSLCMLQCSFIIQDSMTLFLCFGLSIWTSYFVVRVYYYEVSYAISWWFVYSQISYTHIREGIAARNYVGFQKLLLGLLDVSFLYIKICFILFTISFFIFLQLWNI